MSLVARVAVLLVLAWAPTAGGAAERASPAASCKREQDLCRQAYSCPVAPAAASLGADEPYYCRKCQKKLDECLQIAGLQRTVRRPTPKKKRGEFGTTMAGHELKDPKFGTGLAAPDVNKRPRGAEADEPDVPARSAPRAGDGRRKRPASDSSGS